MRASGWFALCLLCACAELVQAEATLPALHVRAWSSDESGFSPAFGVQTDDGVLWLSDNTRLYRFDGIRFVTFEGPPGGPRLTHAISQMATWPEEGLWMGYEFGGLAVLKAGELTEYGSREGLPGGSITSIIKDPQGGIWVAARGGVARRVGDRWERVSLLTSTGAPIAPYRALFDHAGTLWVLSADHLYERPAGEQRFREVMTLGLVANSTERRLTLAPDGAVWMSERAELSCVAPDPKPIMRRLTGVSAGSLLFDRAGNLWIGSLTPTDTLRWLPDARCGAELADSDLKNRIQPVVPTTPTSMQSLHADPMLEDREGNIWAGGDGMLLRYSRSKVSSFPLSGANTTADAEVRIPVIALDHAGTVWVAAHLGDHSVLYEVVDGRIRRQWPAPPFTAGYGDADGTLWFGGRTALVHFVGGTLNTIAPPDTSGGFEMQAISRDAEGALWVSIVRRGLFRDVGGAWVKRGGYEALPDEPAVIATKDPAGAMWFGYINNRIGRVRDSAAVLFSDAEGLAIGNVTAITAGPHLWVGGDSGLALFDGRRFIAMTAPGGAPFTGVTGIVDNPSSGLWLNGRAGITHITRSEINQFLKDQSYHPAFERIDFRDGLPATASPIRPIPSAVQGADGRIWLTLRDGALVFLPSDQLPRNVLAPPVKVWSIAADGKEYDTRAGPIELPAHTTAVELKYTAGSLSVPERNRFRTRLDGSDNAWQDGGDRRDAFYTNLSPRTYTFHVIASNNDGVWNNVGASVQFAILPAWYQSRWFYILCVLVGLSALAGLYRTRLALAHAQTRRLLEARLSERERIARELHDTLLQGFQGITLKFHALANMIQTDSPARKMIDHLLEEARGQIVEGRTRVLALRNADESSSDLADQLRESAESLRYACPATFDIAITGHPVPLTRNALDQAVRIGREALANAFTHAEAHHIEIELTYDHSKLVVRVRDDGRGMEQTTLTSGREGHWGLLGMRERARSLGADLSIWSRPGSGTEVELTVPAPKAYERVPGNAIVSWLKRSSRATRSADPSRTDQADGKRSST